MIWVNFGTEDVHRNAFYDVSFVKISTVQAILYTEA